MFAVYLLESLGTKQRSYVGLTIKNPKERLKEHNSGLSKYTKTYKPWKLVYYEQFYCRLCAEKREIYLKSGIGFKLRKILIDHQDDLK